MNGLEIRQITGREILDSRGNPTVEAEVILADGSCGRGIAPSGASTGIYEAVELRDGDKTRYGGKGVLNAVENINRRIAEKLVGMDASNTQGIDRMLLMADGTKDKSFLGANSTLAVSIACARAAAASLGIPLYRFLGGVNGSKMPIPFMNILNGGAHAKNSIDVQEFMIAPIRAANFKEGVRWCSEVYHELERLLKEKGHRTAVGDEGGFAPDLQDEEEVLKYLSRAIELAGYHVGSDFVFALDAAASEWKSGVKGTYRLPKSRMEYDSERLVEHWKMLVKNYPVLSIEDPLDEEDWEGWKMITKELGSQIHLVGDDLFVTNTERLKKGIEQQCGNCILIKPNQIGTISETLDAIQMAQKAGYKVMISHRSGESEDTFIADLAVAVNADYIKSGAPCRGERTGKYNQLLRIEENTKQ